MTALQDLSKWPQSRLVAAFTSKLPTYPEDYKGIARMPPVATAYAGYRDNKNMVIGDIGIVFNFGERVPVDKDGESNENPNC